MQLADLGAEVIKVERPDGGDVIRAASPFLEGESSTFIRLNRNKRSMTLDLKDPRGNEIFRSLIKTADVLVENLSPGSMDKLGLSYEVLSGDNPRLIYLAISGWGETGPYADHSGLDIIAQAMSGIMSITGEEHGGPVKVGVPVTDLTCGLYGALAVVSALFSRVNSGEGQFIDVTLFESGVSLAVWEAGEYFATGKVHGRFGTAHQRTAPYQAVESSDGHFCLGATSPSTWPALCKVIGREDLIDEPRYATASQRHALRDELIPQIEAVTRTKPMKHWIDELHAVGVPAGAIQTFDQVFAADPQLQFRNFFKDAAHPKLGAVRQIGSPMNLSKTPTRIDTAGPILGYDTISVLEELGVDASEIDQLLNDQVVTRP
jgi:formyl-CoA transferase